MFDVSPRREPSFEPALARALAELPERQRVAVFLAYGDEWTQAEVAELLGVKPATVQKHLERALTRLRQVLAAKNPKES